MYKYLSRGSLVASTWGLAQRYNIVIALALALLQHTYRKVGDTLKYFNIMTLKKGKCIVRSTSIQANCAISLPIYASLNTHRCKDSVQSPR